LQAAYFFATFQLLINWAIAVASSVIATAVAALFIPVTRRVKGYTRIVGKYVIGRRKRFQPH